MALAVTAGRPTPPKIARAILQLRRQNRSYAMIADALAQVGVEVTPLTIGKVCRRHGLGGRRRPSSRPPKTERNARLVKAVESQIRQRGGRNERGRAPRGVFVFVAREFGLSVSGAHTIYDRWRRMT